MSRVPSLETLFFECLRIDAPAERAAYLERACSGDPERLRRVQRMLEAQGSDFLEQAPRLVGERSGQRIGEYRLVEKLGEGGMGSVWRAEQLEPVQRQVALKLVKAGMDSKQVIARFEAERQAQALMDHPHIARVLDGGADESGRPYLVMDLCVGVPITRYCDDARLPMRQRLELFVQVCEAIQHAHQKGVIHRDIKPSNVLVAQQDGRPVPKVIDFGIAKAIEQRLSEHTGLTQGGFVGTLEYMSPEQAARSAGGVDTRSDIYSLGALLYELLTGTTPLSRRRIAEASYGDILRVISDEETPKPSTRVGDSDTDLATISAQRRIEPTRIASLLRGELDWIAMKALEKDRDRRYATVAEFAQDVQRFLADEPVLACPPSAGYRLRKFARRHRAALVAAGALTAALLIAVGGVGWTLRDRADRLTRVGTAVNELLAAADRQLAAQDWPEALATVRRADAAATSGEADPATLERIRVLLRDLEFVQRLESIRSRRATWLTAGSYSTLAPREYAEAFHDHGVDFEDVDSPATIARLSTTPALALPLAAGLDDWARLRIESNHLLVDWQRIEAAAKAIDPEPTRDLIRSAWGKPDATEILALADSIDLRAQHPVTLVNLARTLRGFGELEAGLRLLRRAQIAHPSDFWINFELSIEMGERKDLEASLRFSTAAVAIRPESAAAHNNLGDALRLRGDLDAAVECCRRAIELDPKLAQPRVNLGRTLLDQGKPVEALAVLRGAVEVDPKSSMAWTGVGNLLLSLGHREEALDAARKAIALDPANGHAHANLSDVLRDYGRLDEALAAANAGIAADPRCDGAYVSLGNALGEQGRYAESAAAFRKALELDPDDPVALANLGGSLSRDPAHGEEALALTRRAIELNPRFALGHLGLGNLLLLKGEYEAAIDPYRRAIELSPRLGMAHFGLAQALAQLKRTDEAIAEYRTTLELRPDDPQVHLRLGLALCNKSEYSEAESEFRRVVAIDPDNADLQHNLGVVLTKLGRADEAVGPYRRAAEIDSKNARRHLFLGVALQGRQRFEEAVAAYRRAIELDPEFSMTYGVLGDALHLLDRDDEAIDAYRKAVAVDPEYAEAYHGLGTALTSAGRFAEAVEAIEKSLDIGPTTDELMADRSRALGAASYRDGRWQDALDALEPLVEQGDGGSGFECYFVAMARWRLGDADEARAAYLRAVDRTSASGEADPSLRKLQAEAAELLGL